MSSLSSPPPLKLRGYLWFKEIKGGSLVRGGAVGKCDEKMERKRKKLTRLIRIWFKKFNDISGPHFFFQNVLPI